MKMPMKKNSFFMLNFVQKVGSKSVNSAKSNLYI